MQAGKLRHVVAIQHSGENQDQDTGEPDPNSWSGTDEVWAEVITLSGRDFVTANQASYVASHRVRLRYRPDIVPLTTRFIFAGVALYVVHTENTDGRNAELIALCRSGGSVS